MKIYILADMEGISGIRTMPQVRRDSPTEYAEGRRLMMDDINTAIDAGTRMAAGRTTDAELPTR